MNLPDQQNDNLNPSYDERVCFNCKYLAWLVGVGQGLKCTNPESPQFQIESTSDSGGLVKYGTIPNTKFTCDKFEFAEEV